MARTLGLIAADKYSLTATNPPVILREAAPDIVNTTAPDIQRKTGQLRVIRQWASLPVNPSNSTFRTVFAIANN